VGPGAVAGRVKSAPELSLQPVQSPLGLVEADFGLPQRRLLERELGFLGRQLALGLEALLFAEGAVLIDFLESLEPLARSLQVRLGSSEMGAPNLELDRQQLHLIPRRLQLLAQARVNGRAGKRGYGLGGG